MFFDSSVFWLLMGVVLVMVAFAFKAFAEDQGWTLTWWKGVLALLWYGLFSLSFLTMGTLLGESETGAAFKLGGMLLFVSIILGVGLWRLMAYNPQPAREVEVEA